MSTANSDKIFSGSIAKLYEEYLVPLIFQPYAADLAKRVASRSPARVLEVAAGKYDVDGETVEDALRRELAEELGVEGGTLTFLATFYTSPGWSDEVLDLYLAEGVKPIEGDAPAADWEEQGIEVVRLPFAEALRRAAGPPGDAKTLVALGLYGLKLAGSWTPDQAERPPPDAPARRAARRPA